MSTVEKLLDPKSNDIWVAAPDDSVYEAIKLLSDKSIGALPVVKDNKLVGIISERDYARKVILEGKSSKSTPLSEIMTEHVITVGPEHTIEGCLGLMTENKIRHLPVVEEGKVVGVISIGDLVNAIIKDQKFVIGQLENYIQQAEGQQ